jgi:hypothetical protein
MIPLGYRTRRLQETSRPPGEIGQIFRYSVLLAACWFLLSGGLVYVVIDIFAYVNGSASFSLTSMGISVGVWAMTILVGMSLYLLRPRS